MIEFHDAMNAHSVDDIKHAQNSVEWQKAKALYDQYMRGGMRQADEPKIPLIIHHIWLGSSLPKYAQHFRKTWIDNHPDWTFVLWTDHPSPEFGSVVLDSFQSLKDYLELPGREQFLVMDMRKIILHNQHAFGKVAKNYGEKSDILRYEILYEIGGLYVDTDFECLKPFDELHYGLAFYTGITHNRLFCLYNGLIASASKSPILAEAIKGLHAKPHHPDSLSYSGPYYFLDCYKKRYREISDGVVAFPTSFFYPWPGKFRKQTGKLVRKWIRPESLAIHHWKVSWLK
jgi:mannosyltransferase OCH1-like enzyme